MFLPAKALREVRRYQKSCELLIPRAPFIRLVREIMLAIHPELGIEAGALGALQEAAESMLIRELESSYLSQSPFTNIPTKHFILVTNLAAVGYHTQCSKSTKANTVSDSCQESHHPTERHEIDSGIQGLFSRI